MRCGGATENAGVENERGSKNAGVENAGVEIMALEYRGGKRERSDYGKPKFT